MSLVVAYQDQSTWFGSEDALQMGHCQCNLLKLFLTRIQSVAADRLNRMLEHTPPVSNWRM